MTKQIDYTINDRPVAQVKRVRDAQFGICLICNALITGNQYWDWKKSKWLRTSGTGHSPIGYFRYE